MKNAIAMVETNTVTAGFLATDLILKTAAVKIIFAKTVCPGKYLILFSGEISAVKASHDAAVKSFAKNIADSFVLGNPHEDIFSALYGTAEPGSPEALGIFETYSAASIIVAADAASKTSLVKLIELRVARGMCGKSYMTLTGDVASVAAAIEAAKEKIGKDGMYLDSKVIARPSEKLWKTIL